MVNKPPILVSTRRQFLKSVLPAGALFCLGGGSILSMPSKKVIQEASSKIHKFLADSGMTFKDVYDFAFNHYFIPLMRSIQDDIGKEKFIEILKKASIEAGQKNAQNLAKSLPENDFKAFTAWSRDLDRFWQHVLTFNIVEDTEKVFEIKVTECLWAKTFREADAGDIGYAAICHGDYGFAEGFNPKIKMIRTKTLMQKHECCDHRWVWEA